MKKVYCINCKFDKSGFGVEYDFCKPYLGKLTKKTVIVDDFYEEYHVIKSTEPEPKSQCMSVINKENDCIYYQRKWWRFWLKYYPRKENK